VIFIDAECSLQAKNNSPKSSNHSSSVFHRLISEKRFYSAKSSFSIFLAIEEAAHTLNI